MSGRGRSTLWRVTDCGDCWRHSRAWAANQFEKGEDGGASAGQGRLSGAHSNRLVQVAPDVSSASADLRGSRVQLGWVGLGLHMEFHAGGQWIITSHVRAIAVEPFATGAPC